MSSAWELLNENLRLRREVNDLERALAAAQSELARVTAHGRQEEASPLRRTEVQVARIQAETPGGKKEEWATPPRTSAKNSVTEAFQVPACGDGYLCEKGYCSHTQTAASREAETGHRSSVQAWLDASEEDEGPTSGAPSCPVSSEVPETD